MGLVMFDYDGVIVDLEQYARFSKSMQCLWL